MPPLPQLDQNAVYAQLRRNDAQNKQLQAQINRLEGFVNGKLDVVKYIEDSPGKRSPFFEVIEIDFSAGSTAKREGTTPISTDGPSFVLEFI